MAPKKQINNVLRVQTAFSITFGPKTNKTNRNCKQ